VHAHQQDLAFAVAAVTDGVDQVNNYSSNGRRLLKLVDSHCAYLPGAHLKPLARQPDLGVGKIDHKPGRMVDEFDS
jgi:hypothetical protein